jgi:3alpha(or 20beta)-hydroxysteroid dehydrogenase
MGKLTGKVALVTGGARAMGAATARLFAEEGAQVMIADVLTDEGQALATDLGPTTVFQHLNVADETAWKDAVETCCGHFGGIDILINNAGIIYFGALLDTSLADFKRVIDVNLVGCFLGMRTAAPQIIARGGGAIVNISSVDGMKGSNSIGAYAASKWGVRGMTKVAAMEFGHRGVRVNSIHPGGVNTPMGNPRGMSVTEMNASFYKSVPAQRVGEPIEVARASLFLASDDASYINGAELTVDGGMIAGQYYMGYPGAPGA